MKKLAYGIAGCGDAGKVHAYHFSHDPRIECIAAVDTDRRQAKWFQKHFEFKRVYTDCTKMLNNEKIDILSIASPPGVHMEQIQAGAESGCHIFCEKPIVISEAQIESLEKLVDWHKGLLGIMLPRRFYNNTRTVKKVIDNGLLGNIERICFNLRCYKDRSYYASWRGQKKLAGGGVLMSQSIHSIDQLVYLFGNPTAIQGRIRTTRDYLDIEDEADATVFFKTGCLAQISAQSNDQDQVWQGITEIQGTRGRIVLDSSDVTVWEVPDCPKPDKEEPEKIPKRYKPTYYGPGHLKVINDFITSAYNGTVPSVTGRQSLMSIRMVLAIYESSQKHKKIYL